VAQWLGQFSGRTRETRVQDAEDALKHAVQAFRDVSAPHEREKKAKNVRHLATRLLQTRIRLFRSRLARASEPRMTGRPSAWSDGVDHLREQESATRAGGVEAILVEFGAEAAVVPNTSESADTGGR
jgi:hypothetical protein